MINLSNDEKEVLRTHVHTIIDMIEFNIVIRNAIEHRIKDESFLNRLARYYLKYDNKDQAIKECVVDFIERAILWGKWETNV